MSIKTLLADDHAIVVEGLKEILSHDEKIEVVGSASNGEEVMTFQRQTKHFGTSSIICCYL